jgi:hypothetical protein
VKHLLLILVFMVAGYVLWTISDKAARKLASRFITEHVLRLGFMVVVVLLLVVAAANLPSTQLL